jgi:hypothetical protein
VQGIQGDARLSLDSIGKEPRMKPQVSALLATAACSFLSGCSILDGLPEGPAYDPYKLYLKNSMPVRIEADLLDRYACATAARLICQCMSRLGGTCDCHC